MHGHSFRSIINSSHQCRRMSGRCMSYFQNRAFLKAAIAGFLCLTVPTHQIPFRRFIMQSLWQQAKMSHSVPKSASSDSFALKKTIRVSQRCRPCVVKSKRNFEPIVESIASYYPDGNSYVKIISFLNLRLSHQAQTFHCKPKRSPPTYL